MKRASKSPLGTALFTFLDSVMKKTSFLSKAIFILLAVLILVSLDSCNGRRGNPAERTEIEVEVEEADQEVVDLGFNPEQLDLKAGKIGSGEFFSELLMKLGVSAKDAYDLSMVCDSVFDVRKIRVGNEYKAYYQGDTLQYLVYDKDRVDRIVFKCRPPFSAHIASRPVVTQMKYSDIVIEHSLWDDMLEGGASPLLILSLSDIYAWTVDFFGLQKGDRFKVYYDQKVCDGDIIAVDTVRYAVFSREGEDLCAIMFNQGDGGNIYWNEKGESMRKAFLKAPLSYSRVSSGFSYSRRHPVTRKVQPHTGVDYAAPVGTPVMSIGDGVVTSMKYEGAGGNVVRIKHNSVYKTAYLHLSRYASGIKPGKRVRQGEVIGYVGATGRCTGPHLDFRVWKNGSPVNPLKMDSPPAEPVKQENMDAFSSVRDHWKAVSDTLEASFLAMEIFESL